MDVVIIADLIILLLVLVLPLVSHRVERSLELFLFVMGLAAATSARALTPGLVKDALVHPLPITGAVFVSGVLFAWLRQSLAVGLVKLRLVVSLRVVIFALVAVLGLLSSVITAIIAALVLVELVSAMRFRAEDEVRLVVIACMAIGLGAALTPIGEPLSTIATAKLDQDFWYLLGLLGPWVVPAIVAMGIWAAFQPMRYADTTLAQAGRVDAYRQVVERALRVYLFVMALILLGEGFRPVIDRYVIHLDARLLYWINLVSAILDNATLAAAEISPRMEVIQLRAVLMGLLVSGGMLIPGNIPNIIAANKLGIRSRTWARFGVPLGLVLLVLYFVGLFVFS